MISAFAVAATLALVSSGPQPRGVVVPEGSRLRRAAVLAAHKPEAEKSGLITGLSFVAGWVDVSCQDQFGMCGVLRGENRARGVNKAYG